MAETEDAVDKPMIAVAAENISYMAKITKLKDAILSKLASSNPSMAVSRDLIELRLQQFFPTFCTPIHPPYSFMIRQAIMKLKQEGGSSEEAISRFIEQEYEGLPWGHASFLSHHLEKLCRNGDVLCVNNELYILPLEKNTLAESSGSKRWSGVNNGQAKEFENQCEVEPQRIESNGHGKPSERRIVGSEKHKEGRLGVIEEVRDESENVSGQSVVVEEVDRVKGKVAEVAQELRGVKSKLPEMTDKQLKKKVLKDDIPQPMLGEGKKYVERQQLQIKGASVRKPIVLTIDKEEQPSRVKIGDKGLPLNQQIDIRTEMAVFPCDGEGGGSLKSSFKDMHILKKKRNKALKHKQHKKRKLHYIERNLIAVCAMPAEQQSQSRSNVCQEAHRLHSNLKSDYFESKESRQILGQQLELSTPQRSTECQAPTPESITQSKQKPAKMHTKEELQNSQKILETSFGTLKSLEVLEKKQEQEFQKSEKHLELEIKTKKANFGGKEASVSVSTTLEGYTKVPLDIKQHGREDQNKQLKVYFRRKARKSQIINFKSPNNLPANSV